MADRIMARSGTGYQEFGFKIIRRPMGWPLLLFFSLKFSEIFVTIVLFTGHIYIFSNLTNS